MVTKRQIIKYNRLKRTHDFMYGFHFNSKVDLNIIYFTIRTIQNKNLRGSINLILKIPKNESSLFLYSVLRCRGHFNTTLSHKSFEF